jgi:hypothetical protein
MNLTRIEQVGNRHKKGKPHHSCKRILKTE